MWLDLTFFDAFVCKYEENFQDNCLLFIRYLFRYSEINDTENIFMPESKMLSYLHILLFKTIPFPNRFIWCQLQIITKL
jgi:hypothetical protein